GEMWEGDYAWYLSASSSSSVTTRGYVASIENDGFTPVVSTSWANASVHWIAFGGDDVEAYCVAQAVAPSASTATLNLPFTADTLLALSGRLNASIDGGTSGNATFVLGWQVKDGEKGCAALRQDNGVTTMDIAVAQLNRLYSAPTTDGA